MKVKSSPNSRTSAITGGSARTPRRPSSSIGWPLGGRGVETRSNLVEAGMYDQDQGYPIRKEPKKPALPAPCGSPVKPALVNREADYQIPTSVWSNWTPASGRRELKRELTLAERGTAARRAA